MKILLTSSLIGVFMFFFGFALKAQNNTYTLSNDSLVNFHASQKRVYTATRITDRPKIDGKLDDSCWETGIWSAGFRQQQPAQAQEPSQETEIKVLYDDNNLFVAIRCYDDEPEKMRPILGRRDDFTAGDITGIALDSYNDKRTAFEFNVSAAGQKIDLVHLGAYSWDTNWDAVWYGKSHIGDSAWTVEMRIPFNQLRFADKEEHVWGMHVWRWIDRLAEEDQWKLIPIDAPAMVYIFGELRGIKDIKTKRNFEMLPYAKAKVVAGDDGSNNLGFGLDGKIGVTSDFTLDYTINPDFGQVEADPSVLNLTSYEVFYDEKRPFFLEGNSILNYEVGRDQLFYSRRIGHAPSYSPDIEKGESLKMPENTSILNALKLTGKSKNGLSLGIINSMTAKENATISSPGLSKTETVEPFTNYFISRVKKDYNEGNTVIGGLVTSTIRSIKDDNLNFLPDNSLVAGVDLQHNWLNRKYFVDVKSFYSTVGGSTEAISKLQRLSTHLFQRTDASHLNYDTDLTRMSGWGGALSGGKRSGKFRATGTLAWRSPGVDLNDVGYMRQADFIEQDITLRYQVNEPKGILRNYYVNLTQENGWSYGGEKLSNELDMHSYFSFSNLWSMHFLINRDFFNVDTRQLRGGPALRIDSRTGSEILLQTNSTKDIFIAGGIDVDFWDDNVSESYEYTFHARWQINNRLLLSSHTVLQNRIFNHQYVTQMVVNNKREFLVGKIDRNTVSTTLRMEYFITPELSLQYYANPYASIGKYSDYRIVNESQAKDPAKRYTSLAVLEGGSSGLLVKPLGPETESFEIPSTDFNFQELRSNFVARWEFRPGSTMYFVWSNSRSNYENKYNNSLFDSFGGIFDVKPQNVFMLKFSYWFTL